MKKKLIKKNSYILSWLNILVRFMFLLIIIQPLFMSTLYSQVTIKEHLNLSGVNNMSLSDTTKTETGNLQKKKRERT